MRKTLIIVALVIAGCALPQPPYYTKDGVMQQQRDRDDYECERDARMIRANSCAQIDLYQTCMRSKGYVPQPGTGDMRMC